jgi:hypothetical protein
MPSKRSPNGNVEIKTGKVDIQTDNATESTEKAVHVVLGAPAAVADYVSETVERLKNPAEREKELSNLRTQVERGIEVAEKRGAEVRQQLPSQVDHGLKIAEQRGEEILQQLVEQAKVARERFEPTVRKTVTGARDRGRQVTDTTQEQLRNAQGRVRELV